MNKEVRNWLIKAFEDYRVVRHEMNLHLEFLKELCKKQDKDFDILDFGNLTMYAVEARYPERFLIPSVEEARRSFEIAQDVKEFVLEKLGIKEDEIR